MASIKGTGMYEKEGHWVTVMTWESSGEHGEGSWFERVKKALLSKAFEY